MGAETLAITAIVAAVAATAGTVMSIKGNMAQADAMKKEASLKQAQLNIQAQQARTSQIREARIKQAMIIQAGAGQGASDSSAVAGGVAGVTGQLAENLQAINVQAGFGKAYSKINKESASAQGEIALGQGISSIGQTIFSNSKEIGSIFGGSPSVGDNAKSAYN